MQSIEILVRSRRFEMTIIALIPFIVSTTFTVLNLFIGIIVSAMQAEHEEVAARDREELHNDQTAIIAEIKALRREIAAVRQDISVSKTHQ